MKRIVEFLDDVDWMVNLIKIRNKVITWLKGN